MPVAPSACLLLLLLARCTYGSLDGSQQEVQSPAEQELQAASLLLLRQALLGAAARVPAASARPSTAASGGQATPDEQGSTAAGPEGPLQAWQAGTDPCNRTAPWPGVTCDRAGRVVAVELRGANLSGTLPTGAAGGASASAPYHMPYLRRL